MEQQNKTQGSSVKDKINVVLWIVEMLSMPIEMLLHYGVGIRFARIRAIFGAMAMSAVVMLFPADRWWPLFGLVFIYWGRCVAHSIIWQLRLYHNVPLPDETTYFPGYPLIWKLIPRRPHTYARWVEVGVVFLAGLVISIASRPLGTYLELGAATLGFTLYLRYQATLNRILDMHDQIVVNKNITDGFRERTLG